MSDEPWRVELVRSGGFAGLRRTAAIDVDAAEGAALAAALLAFKPPAAPQRGADRFQYDLTLVHGDERRDATLREETVPEAVRPLLDRLLAQLE